MISKIIPFLGGGSVNPRGNITIPDITQAVALFQIFT